MSESPSAFGYRRGPKGSLSIHLHYPPGWRSSDLRPAVVFFHSGAWSGGNPIGQFEPQAAYLASRGMVTARAEYCLPGFPGGLAERSIHDAKSALRWVRAHSHRLGIDPGRIVAGGARSGGCAAAMAATVEGFEHPAEDLSVPCRPDVLVLFNPVLRFDHRTVAGQQLEPALRPLLSPLERMDATIPPTWLSYGAISPLLPHGQEFMERMTQLARPAEMVLVPNAGGTSFHNPPWRQRTLRRIDEFLASLGYLQGPPTIEVPSPTHADSAPHPVAAPQRFAP